jgi:ATP-binding cassette subfamily B protein
VNFQKITSSITTNPVAFVFNAVKRHAAQHVVILLSVVAGVGCSVGSQYAVKNLVDVLAKDNIAAVWHAFLFLAVLIGADNLSWRVGGWIAAKAFSEVTGDLRKILFEHTLGHSPAFFINRRTGTLAGRISATGNAVFRIESVTVWNVLPPLLAVLGSVVMIMFVDATMGVALILVSLMLGGLLAYLAWRGRHLHQKYAEAAAAVDGQIVDVINNVGLVRSFGGLFRENRTFATEVGKEIGTRRNSLLYLEKLRILHAVITAVLTACLLFWILSRWEKGQATPGDVVLVVSLGFTVLHGTRDLAVALVEMVQDWARLAEALRALLIPHDMPDAPEARKLPVARGAVSLRNIDFSYGGEMILRDFNLDIEAGEHIGLVGKSGSGKSTLLALIQRHYDPVRGEICIDGINIASLSRAGLANFISVVSQDVQLFHRSIAENIRYGRWDASEEEIYAAARAAYADEFIRALPQGYDTLVGERGLRLSGGQRQRLAIARAFLRNAPILLFDEATSALDSESEAIVHQALGDLAEGRTVIAVAHRLSTLRDFDRIVVMAGGRIIEQGSPEDLSSRSGPYRDLLEQQTGMPGG